MFNSWIQADLFSANELSHRFQIPKEEITIFLQFARIYRKGTIIIQEGEQDKTVYMLRVGQVNVYKQVNESERQQIGVIEAINFFGEMALVNDNARIATVEAVSDESLIYALEHPSLKALLSNPLWAELLVSRLCKNLAILDDQVKANTQIVAELQRDKQRAGLIMLESQQENREVYSTVARVFAVLEEFNKIIQSEAIVGTKGWAFLQAYHDMIRLLVRIYLPDIPFYSEPLDMDMLKVCIQEMEKKMPASMYRLTEARFNEALKKYTSPPPSLR